MAEVERTPVEWERLTVRAQVLWAMGKRPESDADLGALLAKLADVAAFQIAQLYAHRQDRDRAFEWLQRSARQRDPGIALCKSDPTFAPLHGDPRWKSFLLQLGLADDQVR